MARAHFCASLLGLGLMLAASSTDARELEFFIENRLGGDSNVFRRSEESTGDLRPKAGGVWEISPRLTLRDEQDQLEYDFRYQPTYERYFAIEDGGNESGVSGVDHMGAGDFLWQVSPVSSIGGTGRFTRQRRLREGFFDLSPLLDPPLVQTDNEYVQRARGELFFVRAFTPSTSVRGAYTFDDFDLSQQEQGDSRLHSVSGGVYYSLSEQLRVGLNGTFRDRETKASFDPDPGSSGTPETDIRETRSETQTVDFAVSAEYAISAQSSISIAVGPSFFDTRDENSLGDVSHNRDDSVFASVTASRVYRRGRVELSYTRSEGGGGGAAAATSILDSIVGEVTHRPTRRWTIRAVGTWTHRASIASDAFLGRDIRTDSVSAFASAQRRLTENFSIIASIQYSWSRLDDFRPPVLLVPPSPTDPGIVLAASSTRNTAETIQGFLSLRYTFDPYVF